MPKPTFIQKLQSAPPASFHILEPGKAVRMNAKFSVPWWRVLKDGKPSRHMPGGVERQSAILREEGMRVNR